MTRYFGLRDSHSGERQCTRHAREPSAWRLLLGLQPPRGIIHDPFGASLSRTWARWPNNSQEYLANRGLVALAPIPKAANPAVPDLGSTGIRRAGVWHTFFSRLLAH